MRIFQTARIVQFCFNLFIEYFTVESLLIILLAGSLKVFIEGSGVLNR
jgi:hypothetical protein